MVRIMRRGMMWLVVVGSVGGVNNSLGNMGRVVMARGLLVQDPRQRGKHDREQRERRQQPPEHCRGDRRGRCTTLPRHGP